MFISAGAGVVTLTGSGGELSPQSTGPPVGKHRALAHLRPRSDPLVPPGPSPITQPGFSVWVNTALAEEVVNHTVELLTDNIL